MSRKRSLVAEACYFVFTFRIGFSVFSVDNNFLDNQRSAARNLMFAMVKDEITSLKMTSNKKFTIDSLAIGELVEKKSRFIAQIKHVDCEDEALDFITAVKKEHSQARHNVYAYIVSETGVGSNLRIRFTDDGEPSQTAGKPTLEALQYANLENVACVVTRYFGGTLLGTGGLVRAYSGAVRTAIENAMAEGQYVEIVDWDEFTESCAYSDFENLKHKISLQNGIVLNIDYGAEVTLHYKIPKQ